MRKEYLEALENIKSLLKDDWVDSYWKTDYETIKQALQRLETIDNAKPSEVSFIWLNQRITRLEDDLQHYTMVEKDKALASITEKELNHLTSIKQALLKSLEQEKILKILKEKKVELMSLYLSSSVEQYNNQFVHDENKLTQNEFDLLKRYLK